MLNIEQCKIVRELKKQYDFTKYTAIIDAKYDKKVQSLWMRDYYKLVGYLNSKIEECKNSL